MSFKSPMFLLDPAPPLRRVRGHDYAGSRRGYGPTYGRRDVRAERNATPSAVPDLPAAPAVPWTFSAPQTWPRAA
jgi:hypothetical protein